MAKVKNLYKLEMKGISKRFDKNKACSNIDFQLIPGEIHAILGENEAGKTTFASILYGLCPTEDGEIYIQSKKVNISTPKEALKHGIGLVPQEPFLISSINVLENIILGSEPLNKYLLNMKKAHTLIEEISQQYKLQIDLQAKIEELSKLGKIKAEICRALFRNIDILILDEPFLTLTPLETEELLKLLKKIREENKSIILTSCKPSEVLKIASRITVFKEGQVVGTVTSQTTENELKNLMGITSQELTMEKQEKKTEEIMLEINSLVVNDHQNRPKIKDLSLQVMRGEILGIAGPEKHGQEELVDAILNPQRALKGTIKLLNSSEKKFFLEKVALIPEVDNNTGWVREFPLAQNMIIRTQLKEPFVSMGLLKKIAIKNYTKNALDDFGITAETSRFAYELSPSIKQLVLTARTAASHVELIIFFNTTRGISSWAKTSIQNYILQEKNSGKGILLILDDLQELISLSDRIAILFHGQIEKIISAKRFTQEKLEELLINTEKNATPKNRGGIRDEQQST